MERNIDLVIPMVFPQDPEWRREYLRAVGGGADTVTNVRYRSWGTEELLVRCCMRYMPWLRRIHLLLSGESQVQPWMAAVAQQHAELPAVQLVFHREFIPEESLPCFSSPCIEMFLYRIPGLAEMFVYGNDDVFPLSPLSPEDFFRKAGDGSMVPCQSFHEARRPARPNIFERACLGQQELVVGGFGKICTGWLRGGHSMAAILKSTCEEVWRIHGEEIRRHVNPLRRTDRDFNQYLFSLYQHFTGRYVSHVPHRQYVGPRTATEDIAAIIRDPQCGILCLNDNENMQDWRRRAEIVKAEIAEKLVAATESQHTEQEAIRHYEANKALTVWVSYHRDELVRQYGLKDDAEHRIFATHREPDGMNINRLNPVYSEMVTMWYVWKHVLRSDVVGFEHYRRHLQVGRPLPEKGECQVFSVCGFGARTVYEQYARWHNARDMNVMLRLLDERYGEGNPYARHIRESHRLIARCTFLMRWEDFVLMCEFLFPLLEDFGRAMGMSDGLGTVELWHAKAASDFGGRRTEYQCRVVSFLAERLISAWIATHMQYQKPVNVGIVHYNTPEMTAATVRSVFKHTPNAMVTIFDNSDKEPFIVDGVDGRIEVIDNTRGQVIDFGRMLEAFPDRDMSDMEGSRFGSAKHCRSVDMLADMLGGGFVLMDSDVLVRKDITPLADSRFAWVGQVKTNRTKYGIRLPKVSPFLCFLNVPMMKRHGIRYFNGEKMYGLSRRRPDMGYDTGCWFYEAVGRAGLPVRSMDIGEYIHHLGSASWKDKDQQAWLEEHKDLWK